MKPAVNLLVQLRNTSWKDQAWGAQRLGKMGTEERTSAPPEVRGHRPASEPRALMLASVSHRGLQVRNRGGNRFWEIPKYISLFLEFNKL